MMISLQNNIFLENNTSHHSHFKFIVFWVLQDMTTSIYVDLEWTEKDINKKPTNKKLLVQLKF
jgi:hypothetical protein